MIYEGKDYKCITHPKYKYELVRGIHSWCRLGKYHFKSEFMELKRDGTFILPKEYASDGCSGPTWDTPNTMHGGFGHDGFYQALREGLLPQSLRKEIDRWFYYRLRSDGVNCVRACYYYYGVRVFGAKHAKQTKGIF